MNPTKIHQIAFKIADKLFVNGNGETAENLKMISKKHSNMGGWCHAAVVDQIVQVLTKEGDALCQD